jgi:hypothetical protein
LEEEQDMGGRNNQILALFIVALTCCCLSVSLETGRVILMQGKYDDLIGTPIDNIKWGMTEREVLSKRPKIIIYKINNKHHLTENLDLIFGNSGDISYIFIGDRLAWCIISISTNTLDPKTCYIKYLELKNVMIDKLGNPCENIMIPDHKMNDNIDPEVYYKDIYAEWKINKTAVIIKPRIWRITIEYLRIHE